MNPDKSGCYFERNFEMKRKRKGFTLIELIAVAMIIALLAGFVAPKIFKNLGRAKGNIAVGQIAQIAGKLEAFAIECHRYPTQTEGLGGVIGPGKRCKIVSPTQPVKSVIMTALQPKFEP